MLLGSEAEENEWKEMNEKSMKSGADCGRTLDTQRAEVMEFKLLPCTAKVVKDDVKKGSSKKHGQKFEKKKK